MPGQVEGCLGISCCYRLECDFCPVLVAHPPLNSLIELIQKRGEKNVCIGHYSHWRFFLSYLISSTSRWTPSSESTSKSLAVPSKAFCAWIIAEAEALLITTSPVLRSKKRILSPSFKFSFLLISIGTVTCPLADT